MTNTLTSTLDRLLLLIDRAVPSDRITSIGRTVALLGVVLPLLLIGVLKFQQIEVEALIPLISGTPWLSWLYAAFGQAGTSYFLGVVEIVTGLLLAASPWSARAGVIGGAIGTAIFATTVSIMFALPIWDGALNGFPWINPLGQFLIKDVVLLGASIVILGENLTRIKDVRIAKGL